MYGPCWSSRRVLVGHVAAAMQMRTQVVERRQALDYPPAPAALPFVVPRQHAFTIECKNCDRQAQAVLIQCFSSRLRSQPISTRRRDIRNRRLATPATN